MAFQTERHRYEVLARLSLLALYIIVASDIIIIIAAHLIPPQMVSGSEARLVRNVLFIVAVSELAAMYYIKKTMLARTLPSAGNDDLPAEKLRSITIIIAALCVSISLYGLVAVVLGSELEVLLVFVAISLIGYQAFRLRPRDLEQ